MVSSRSRAGSPRMQRVARSRAGRTWSTCVGDSFVARLTTLLGPAVVFTDDATLDDRRHDYWVLSHLDDLLGRGAPRPRCVVRPRSVDDVVTTVDACREAGVAIVPFGLGSGVCGGVRAHPDR